MTILGCHLLFHCHVADGNVAPASRVREDGGGEVSWLTLTCRCLCPFVGAVVGFGGHSLSFVGGHLHLWAVVFIFWLVVVTGHSWVVIGVRCCVVVAIGSVVGLFLWLVEERSDVTNCDISVMFKLACEITCTISHDFLAVYTQSWSNLGRGEIQPSGLVSVLLSLGEAHLPTSTSENHPSLAELSRNYRGTIKTSRKKELMG